MHDDNALTQGELMKLSDNSLYSIAGIERCYKYNWTPERKFKNMQGVLELDLDNDALF